MKNDLVSNALQKFYSALKNLKDFSINNDIIDNISSIDCFFSEFRNITFVMQKDFSDGKVKSIYEELCSKYLKNDKMKWFIKQRNNTIKQAPIKLQKSIIYASRNMVTKWHALPPMTNRWKISWEPKFLCLALNSGTFSA